MTDFPFNAGIDATASLGGSLPAGGEVSGGVGASTTLGGSLHTGLTQGITQTATLGGSLVDTRRVVGGISATGTLAGGLLAAVGIDGGVEQTATVGGVARSTPRVSGGVAATVTLGGSWRVTAKVTSPGVNVRVFVGGRLSGTAATAAETVENQGLSGRRFVPVLVRMREVVSVAQASTLNALEAFLVSNSQILDPALSASGAGNGYLGFVVSKSPVVRLAFRPPNDNEVVWSVPDGTLLRYQNEFDSARQTWTRGWFTYRSLPQRFLDGLKVFDIFDPDHIYDYYAAMVGGAMSRMYVDNVDLLGFRDPDKVPLQWIPEAAAQVGATYDPSDSEPQQRAKLALAIPSARIRSTSASVTLILQSLGYSGYANEGWARITWASVDIRAANIGVDVTLETSDERTILVSSTPGDANNKSTAFAYLFRDENPLQPSAVPPVVAPTLLTMTVGATTRVFEFTNTAVITPGAVAVAIGALSTDTMANLLAAMLAQFGAALDSTYTMLGVSGLPFSQEGGLQNIAPSYIDRPHAYDYRVPDRYWASQRLVIHVMNRDGSPLSGGALNNTFKTKLRNEIAPILGASAKILWFATDREVGSEGVAIGETFNIT